MRPRPWPERHGLSLRALVLAGWGLVTASMGWSLLVGNATVRVRAFGWMPDALDENVVGWAMVVCGAVATAVGLVRLRSTSRSWWEIAAWPLVAIPMGLEAFVLASATIIDSTVTSLPLAARDLVLVALISLTAGWPEPSPPPTLTGPLPTLPVRPEETAP